MSVKELLDLWQRQQEFQLKLSQVRLNDEFSAAEIGEKPTVRRDWKSVV